MAVPHRSLPVATGSRWSGESASCVDWRVSMADPIVSILLVTWKRIDLLEDCLNGIAAAKPIVPFVLVIVDNGGSLTDGRGAGVDPRARVGPTRGGLLPSVGSLPPPAVGVGAMCALPPARCWCRSV